MRYHIVTFGCQMNKADSERIASILEEKGYSPASKEKEADLIVVNMCSVRQSAVDRVYGLSPKFKKLKKEKPELKTVLTGCILKKDRPKFRKFFDSLVDFEKLEVLPLRKGKNLALIPVSNGCNNFCTYCVVPHTRGKLVCRSRKEIIKEAKEAAKKGFGEIWLLGENVNDYKSPDKESFDFADLLKEVNSIPGEFKIRFTSPHPKDFTDKLIKAMAESEKAARFLNLPLQSGDDRILKKMNRPYTAKQYKTLVEKIRAAMPDINLSTDAIVGFPGETKEQFRNTAKLFKQVGFDMAYVAKYSPRPGTAAFLMKDGVPLKEKKRREKILVGLVKHAQRQS